MIKGRKLNSWKEGKRSAVFVRIKLSEIRLDSSSEEEMSRCLSGELFPSQMTHFLGIKFFWDPERQNDSFSSKLKKGSRSPLIGLISFVCVIPFWTHRFIDLVIPAFSSFRSGTGRLHSISHNSLVGVYWMSSAGGKTINGPNLFQCGCGSFFRLLTAKSLFMELLLWSVSPLMGMLASSIDV